MAKTSRPIAFLKNVLGILGVTALLLEAGARILPEKKPRVLFNMTHVPEWDMQPWSVEWQREHDELRRTFRAYEIYGLDPHQGKLISIGKEGFRHSDGGVVPPTPNHVSVGVFGGSTLWGSFARDNHTIPSELNHLLSRDSIGFENYGQIGFVFTQELHEALRLTYSGQTERVLPQMMVFIDGVNDSMSALSNFTQGVKEPSGLPWEYPKYRFLFQLGRTGEVSFGDIIKKSKFIRLVYKVLEQKGLRQGDEKGIWIEPTEEDKSRVASEAAATYLKAIRVAHATFSNQGIQCLFVLQPILPYKKQLTKSESGLIRKNQNWLPYLTETFEKIVKGAKDLPTEVAFVDLSHLFENQGELEFYDPIHYTESANQKIADALAPSLAILSKTVLRREVANAMQHAKR